MGAPSTVPSGRREAIPSHLDVAVRTAMHPVSVAALVALLVNDHVLKAAFPGPATGKVSDLAWPLVATPLVALLLVPWAGRLGRTGWASAACLLAAAPFVAINVSPEAARMVEGLLGAVGVPTRITVDATDLWCLPAFVWPWFQLRAAGRRWAGGTPHRRPRWGRRTLGVLGPVQIAVLAVTTFATVATSCDDGRPRVAAVTVSGDGTLVADRGWSHAPAIGSANGDVWREADDEERDRAYTDEARWKFEAAAGTVCRDGRCASLEQDGGLVLVRTEDGATRRTPLTSADEERRLARYAASGPCSATPSPPTVAIVDGPAGDRVIVSRDLAGVVLVDDDEVTPVSVLGTGPGSGGVRDIVGPELTVRDLLTLVIVAVVSVRWSVAVRRDLRRTGQLRSWGPELLVVVGLTGSALLGGALVVLGDLSAGVRVGLRAAVAVYLLGWLAQPVPPAYRGLRWRLAVRIAAPWAVVTATLHAYTAGTLPWYLLAVVVAVGGGAVVYALVARAAPLPPIEGWPDAHDPPPS